MTTRKNEQCWCGSGLKYKHCHLGRADEAPLNPFAALKEISREFSKSYCLHPERKKGRCSGKIVKCHSVSKANALRKIAEDGHVIKIDLEHADPRLSPPTLSVKRIGINQASTFSGFCGQHDCNTFEIIDQDIDDLEEQHFFLYHYRSFCREYFSKKAFLSSFPILRRADKGRPALAQFQIQNRMDTMEQEARKSLSEMDHEKNLLDEILLSRSYADLKYYVIRFEHPPDVLCSASIYPECSFAGERLQYENEGEVFEKETFDSLSFSCIPTREGGFLIFSWLVDPHLSCFKLIRSLNALEKSRVTGRVIGFFYEFSENVFCRPSWWHSLSSTKQSQIVRSASTLGRHLDKCLTRSTFDHIDWGLGGIQTNLDLGSTETSSEG